MAEFEQQFLRLPLIVQSGMSEIATGDDQRYKIGVNSDPRQVNLTYYHAAHFRHHHHAQ